MYWRGSCVLVKSASFCANGDTCCDHSQYSLVVAVVCIFRVEEQTGKFDYVMISTKLSLGGLSSHPGSRLKIGSVKRNNIDVYRMCSGFCDVEVFQCRYFM